MIWVNCIFRLLLFTVITCTPEISHRKSRGVHKPYYFGAPVDQDPKDPRYLKLANLSMEQYKSDVKSNQTYTVSKVTKATEQVVAGIITEISFYAKPSVCQNDVCPMLSCYSSIFEQAWLGKREIEVMCDPLPLPPPQRLANKE